MTPDRIDVNEGDVGDLASDLLQGAEEIAQYLFGDGHKRRRVYQLADQPAGPGRLPFFRMGSLLCARKSTLRQWVQAQERESAARNPQVA